MENLGYKVWFRSIHNGREEWNTNSIVLPTAAQAEGYGRLHYSMWTVPDDWEVRECSDSPTHRYDMAAPGASDKGLVPIENG